MAELDIQGILAELNREGVEFLIIGGVAVGFHGYVRATKDVDIVPAPDPSNLDRLTRVLSHLDAEVEGAEEFFRGRVAQPTRSKRAPEDVADLKRLRQARGEDQGD